SWRGLIRLSGLDVRRVLGELLSEPAGQTPLPARTLIKVRLRRPPLPALLAFFAEPHSYTGQDVAEIQVPGHPALLDRLIHAALDAGARPAEPGEFTFRAFLAGKLDLTQAEGIAATIAATSESQLQAAAMLRQGRLGSLAAELVDELGQALALVEAGIDFTDQEDVVPIGPAELAQRLAAIANRLELLLAQSRPWGAIEAVPRVVLAGAPSAGKSTLFNALLGRDRALVSPTPGTTRDVLIEPVEWIGPQGQPVELMLVDIAGLDAPAAALDEQVQAVARRAIEQADLILLVRDPTQPRPLPTSLPTSVAVLPVHTKADLVPPHARAGGLWVSARTGEHLDTLKREILNHLAGRGASVRADMLALQPRHERQLHEAAQALHAARELVQPQATGPHDLDESALSAMDKAGLAHAELVAGRMHDALDALAGLGGQLTPDDILGRIFSTFCVGK
ncbi:MAG TPA: GTPase, partial [Phycisphaeraceae bacterium]